MEGELPLAQPTWPWADKTELAIQAECFETPETPIRLILDRELLPPIVLDPCCGRGQLAQAAQARGHITWATDLYDWGYGRTGLDFLASRYQDMLGELQADAIDMGMLFNPPFSKACDFVEKALVVLQVRKVVCYQRFAWYESRERREFWAAFPPNRIYVTESRWDCWRIDKPPEERKGSRPYPHAWYVWERDQPRGTVMGRLEA